jgi:hypothetical protein
MMGFLDAEKVLSDLRKGESILTDKIYYITFNNQTTSQDDLSELKSRCARLGYSFNSVELHQSHESHSPLFFYLVRNLPAGYPTRQFKKYAQVEEAIS